MKVLLTGGAGQIGSYVAARLKDKHAVTILDVKPSRVFPDLDFLDVDLTDRRQTAAAVKGFDAVVHLAAIPNPFNDPGDTVLSTNLVSTYNLLEAVREDKIGRIVYGGSDSESGFGIHHVNHTPLYLPVDEEHPCWCHEAYGLSKYFCERMCEQYSRAYRIETVALRYCWVWLDSFRRDVDKLLAKDIDGKETSQWFGAYIFPEDVAQAVDLALTFSFRNETFPFESFYITAEETSLTPDSLSAFRKIFASNPPPIKNKDYYDKDPHAPFFDITKARNRLGFRPQFTWRDLDSPERQTFNEKR